MAAKAKTLVSPIRLREIRKKLDALIGMILRTDPFVTKEIAQAHAHACRTAREDFAQEIEAMAYAREQDAVELERLRKLLEERDTPREGLKRAREELSACWQAIGEARSELPELSTNPGQPLDGAVQDLLDLVGVLREQIPGYRWEETHQRLFAKAMARNRGHAGALQAQTSSGPATMRRAPSVVVKRHRCLAVRDEGVDRDLFTVHFLDAKTPTTHYAYTLVGALERYAQNGHDRRAIQEDTLVWLRNAYMAEIGTLELRPYTGTSFQIRIVSEDDVTFEKLTQYPDALWGAP